MNNTSSIGSRSRLSREFHELIAEIEELVKETTSLTGDELARARDKLNARVAEAKQSVEDMGVAVAERARRGAKATNNYVHEQPWKAIGASAAVAFLLGFVLSRR